jgi:hypothetical protein
MPDGLEPKSGSVRPKQPIASPAAIRGSQLSFCSSLPYFQIAYIASEPCTETSERTPESTASSSMHARPYATALVPAQPYPSRCMPSRPSSPRPRASSRAGQLAGLEPLGDVRTHLALEVGAHGGADRPLVLDEQRVSGDEVEGGDGAADMTAPVCRTGDLNIGSNRTHGPAVTSPGRTACAPAPGCPSGRTIPSAGRARRPGPARRACGAGRSGIGQAGPPRENLHGLGVRPVGDAPATRRARPDSDLHRVVGGLEEDPPRHPGVAVIRPHPRSPVVERVVAL